MALFKTFTVKFTAAIAAYKAQRVKNVIDSYIALVDAQVIVNVPVALKFYRELSKGVVDATYANPQVAIDLAKALEAANDVYAPVLKRVWAGFEAELGNAQHHPALDRRVKQLEADVALIGTP